MLRKAFEPQRRRPSIQLSPKGGEGDCFPSRKREGIEGRAKRKGKITYYWHMVSHRTGECQMDFMSLFSLRLRVFAVNDLRLLG